MLTMTPAPAKLRVAFLGGAWNSAVGRVHRAALELDSEYELVAGCFSRNPASNQQTAAHYHVDPKRIYGSLSELIEAERDRLDAIIILTPTDQHFEHIQACRKARLPIICEKSMVATLEQVQEIFSTYEKEKELLLTTFNYTGYPMIRELKRAIAEGEFGVIKHIRAEMPQESFLKVDQSGKPIVPQSWRLRDGSIPTVSLDLGVHLHSLVYFLTAAHPERLVAASGSHGHFGSIIDSINCLVRFSNSMDGAFWFTKAALGHRNGLKIEIYGTSKSALWVQERPEQLITADSYGTRTLVDRASPGQAVSALERYSRFKPGHPAGFIEAFANHYIDIAEVLRKYKSTGEIAQSEYVFGPEVVLRGLGWMSAVVKSLRHHSWVDCND